MIKIHNRIFGTIILLLLNITLQAQCKYDTLIIDKVVNYHIINECEYSFDELVNEGINTLANQLDILDIPIRHMKNIIKKPIRKHHFTLNKNTKYCTISFAYPSFSPQGDSILLSGLVTVPIDPNNKPLKMLIYHRILAPTYSIAPSSHIPIEAVLTADNTICVFPDYYGCGISLGNNLPYVALNYHAKCAVECALVALDIIKDHGIELSDNFYTWNTGYSQGGGYALATHKYIETQLPDSLIQKINLKWSLCGDGVYEPLNLFKMALNNRSMGSTPAIYLLSLKGLIETHYDYFNDIDTRCFFSDEALSLRIDSLILINNESLWEIVNNHKKEVINSDPFFYFNNLVLDTTTFFFEKIETAFNLDECISDWHPKSMVVLEHSKKDDCIPYKHAVMTYSKLLDNGGNCILHSPFINLQHSYNSILFFFRLLSLREDQLFNKYSKKNRL